MFVELLYPEPYENVYLLIKSTYQLSVEFGQTRLSIVIEHQNSIKHLLIRLVTEVHNICIVRMKDRVEPCSVLLEDWEV